jgi:antitoxin (DNA-binding transcriptional repressor) of toxin-antitoxin stability system
VITKRRKPVAKLVPFEEKRPDIFGYMKGTVSIRGDIVGPTGETWDADA